MPTVMIAEDDLLMADMLSDILVQNGYEVCGIARTVDKAVEIGERYKPDLAILDIGLADGGLGTDIPARLKNAGRMGVLYASGHVGQMALTKADGQAILSKPYRTEDVIHGLKVVEQIIDTDEATRRCPTGFFVLSDASKSAPVRNAADAELAEQSARVRRQQAELARFGFFALAERSLGHIFVEAARVCSECFEVPCCTIYRYRNEENDLIVEAGIGWNQGVIGRVVSQADNNSPQGRAFISRGSVTCGDLSKDTTFVQSSLYAEHGIVSTLDVAILSDYNAFGVPYGVLAIDGPEQKRYDICDIDFLAGIANVLAQAVDATKRRAALQIADDRLQNMVDDRNRFFAMNNALLESKNRLLGDRTLFVREMLHRVRNNFQLVYGMLSNQLQITTDAAGARGIGAIARRVMTLAQIHDHLLASGLSRTIDFGTFLPSLCASFEELGLARHPSVKLTCHCDHVDLDLDSITAMALVVSELVQNSYAHAFSDGTGSIGVSLSVGQSNEAATIVLTDDGAGFSESNGNRSSGLGLVHRLMEQLGGAATYRTNHGSEWTLTFPVRPSAGAEQL
jgi:two-component sensor histidine kinase/ActR/RegA family two-component response regulator